MTIFFIILHLLGLISLLPTARKVPIWFISTTGFVWGLILWILSSMATLLLGMDYSWLNIAILILPILLVVIYLTIKNKVFPLETKDWLILAASMIGISILSFLVTRSNFVNASTDSFAYIYHGRVMAASGLVPWSINAMTGYGAFISIIQMASNILPGELINGFQTIMGVLLIITLFISMFEILKQYFNRFISLIITGVLVLVLGSKMFQFHLFYIHSNLPAAVLLFLSLYSFWHLIKNGQEAWIAPGIISLTGFSLTRIEGPLYAVIILLLVTTLKTISTRKRLLLVLPYTLFTLFWYIFIILNVQQNDLLSNGSLLLIIGSLVGLLVFTLLSELIPTIIEAFPELLLIIMLFGLIMVILIEPEHMILSITHFWQNLVNIYYWSWSWFVVIAALPFLIMDNQEEPENRVFIYVFAGYILIVLLLVLARIPYRLGETDTANRLMLQILPVLLFAIACNASKIKNWFSKP